MGSTAFRCACGFRFLDSTDDRGYVAHLLPERAWFPFLDAVDEAVEHGGPSPGEKAEACMALRAWRPRLAWQCPACGALYVEDQEGTPHRFSPDGPAVPRDLFGPERSGAVARERLALGKRLGEEAYDGMYESSSPSGATACYSEAKEAFRTAIQAARELGLEEEAKALEARLDHLKAVFRSQF